MSKQGDKLRELTNRVIDVLEGQPVAVVDAVLVTLLATALDAHEEDGVEYCEGLKILKPGLAALQPIVLVSAIDALRAH